MKLVALYLAAIVAANLSVAYFGPASAPINAFLFVGLDITARDSLHERWRGRGLLTRMAALIVAGSAIAYALSLLLASPALPEEVVRRIALASLVAFVVAATLDAVVYHLLRRQDLETKVYASNAISAAADSVLFTVLAFGAFLPAVIALQWLAKCFGGALWLWVLTRLGWWDRRGPTAPASAPH